MKVRRAVKGHPPEVKAIIVNDTEVDAITKKITPRADSQRAWEEDETVIQPRIEYSWSGVPFSGHRYCLLSV